jgi:hypothetical protein
MSPRLNRECKDASRPTILSHAAIGDIKSTRGVTYWCGASLNSVDPALKGALVPGASNDDAARQKTTRRVKRRRGPSKYDAARQKTTGNVLKDTLLALRRRARAREPGTVPSPSSCLKTRAFVRGRQPCGHGLEASVRGLEPLVRRQWTNGPDNSRMSVDNRPTSIDNGRMSVDTTRGQRTSPWCPRPHVHCQWPVDHAELPPSFGWWGGPLPSLPVSYRPLPSLTVPDPR